MTVTTKAKADEKPADPEGLTLRDEFALKAISGCLSHGRNFEKEALAQEAYELADAMIAARKKELK